MSTQWWTPPPKEELHYYQYENYNAPNDYDTYIGQWFSDAEAADVADWLIKHFDKTDRAKMVLDLAAAVLRQYGFVETAERMVKAHQYL